MDVFQPIKEEWYENEFEGCYEAVAALEKESFQYAFSFQTDFDFIANYMADVIERMIRLNVDVLDNELVYQYLESMQNGEKGPYYYRNR